VYEALEGKKAKNGSGFTPKKMAGVVGQNGFDGP